MCFGGFVYGHLAAIQINYSVQEGSLTLENRTRQDDKLIFVLDIGTRSVVGLAGHREGDIFAVDAWHSENHERRAMIDGQIEDIEQVAIIARRVKENIENQLNIELTRVSVAAAGRALKTCRATAEIQLPAGVPITSRMVYQLEHAAVNAARESLETEDTDVPYYCAGHSVVRYLLDDYPFTSIIDHRGQIAKVEIIATFLPAEVVESLRHCMSIIGLEIDTLTLEPIAAMRAVIPSDIRLLNLALIDIGAGTSDIALSSGGSVAGYTMATVAGDEVTEAIIKNNLVDFATGEGIKLSLSGGAQKTYTDILGFEHDLDLDEIMQVIDPAVEKLAHIISDKILECNEGSPAAAFLVGGGSKAPGLCEKISERLELGKNKVALAGTNFSGRILNENSGLDDPEYATPVGIALIACENAENEGTVVTVNNQRVRLFTPASSSVMDALLIGGYNYSDLMGRNGRSLTFTLNGVRTVLRGTPYTAAELSVNGRTASLSTPIESGDSIEIIPATSGEDAFATIEKYSNGQKTITVSLNGTALLAGLVARVNGTVATADTSIFEQDAVEIFSVDTVGELCEAAGVPLEDTVITVNGVKTGPEHEMNDNDEIIVKPAEDGSAPAKPKAEPAVAPVPAIAIPAESAEKTVENNAIEKAAASPSAANGGVSDADAALPEAVIEPAAHSAASALAANPAAEAQSAVHPRTPQDIAEEKQEEKEEPKLKILSTSAALQTGASTPPPAKEADNTGAKPEQQAPPPNITDAAPVETPAPMPERPENAENAEAQAETQTEEAGEEAPPPARRTTSLRIELNGKTVVLPPKPGGAAHQLFDMMALVDIDPANPQGLVKVLLNGQDASYLEELHNGDKVEIGWEKR